MTLWQQIATIAAVAAGTMLTRYLPFALFPDGKKPPPFILYLGSVLPAASISLLVVYSLKDLSLVDGSHGISEAIAIAVIVLLHRWKKNTLLSILGGTALYMALVQFVFVSAA